MIFTDADLDVIVRVTNQAELIAALPSLVAGCREAKVFESELIAANAIIHDQAVAHDDREALRTQLEAAQAELVDLQTDLDANLAKFAHYQITVREELTHWIEATVVAESIGGFDLDNVLLTEAAKAALDKLRAGGKA